MLKFSRNANNCAKSVLKAVEQLQNWDLDSGNDTEAPKMGRDAGTKLKKGRKNDWKSAGRPSEAAHSGLRFKAEAKSA